jgi:uncharacterized cupredoxin-like copper-binding protein
LLIRRIRARSQLDVRAIVADYTKGETKMRRLFVLLSLLIVLTLVLAGCPSSAEPGAAATATPAEVVATPEEATETPEVTGGEAMTETEEITGAEEVTGTEEMTGTEEETGTTGGAAEAAAVQVSLVEYSIEMPTSLPAGPTTFEITNNGTEEHGFEIEGEGVDAALEPRLQPGEMGTLEVDLQPGTYEIYCPVDGHADQGMRIELTVTG